MDKIKAFCIIINQRLIAVYKRAMNINS
uniref:Uncharacterized protein n=1 Tax=Rhizophora mucronata TaxID=61149 RepID=A0A2P2P1Q8_RHIMU